MFSFEVEFKPMVMQKVVILLLIVALGGCKKDNGTLIKESELDMEKITQKAEEFATFRLTTSLTGLTEKEKAMLPKLFEAAGLMDAIFWKEAWGNKEELMRGVTHPDLIKLLNINYGPWERLGDNQSFVPGIGTKPAGAGFYPADMSKEEFEAWEDPLKNSLYTVIQRSEDGSLKAVPYHEAFSEEITRAAALLREAAALAEDPGLQRYLDARAEALLTDDYFESDMAWMEMKENTIDFVIGPIETYEDQLFGYKAAHEAYVLVKDREWSHRLEKYSALLPALQKALPVEEAYKTEVPGSESDMNVYDAVYYAGDCNAGSKTIAINLPNDEKVQAASGSRKLQLKNSMQAKFDKILVPIADLLVASDQRQHVKFDAFFENTMFHEVAHGLGMGMTLDGKTTVREALRDNYTSLEESKADILGLWCVCQLNEMGELTDKDLMDNFVTFMAGIFRSVRFGAASAHGKANMIRFNYFQKAGAFEKDSISGTYRVDFEKMKEAMVSLSAMILKIQGDGAYEKAGTLIREEGVIGEDLQKDLDRIAAAGIPRDIIFEQGPAVIGL